MKMPCQTIVFEGCDRLGKSTQVSAIIEKLRSMGFKVAYIKSPFDDKFTQRLIYWSLKNGLAQKFQNLFQVVHFVNKLICEWFILPKLRRENDFIISDRWTTSMYVFGTADGANERFTKLLVGMLEKPEFSIVLDGEPHISSPGDSYENDTSLQKRARALYQEWVKENWMSAALVNANQPVQDVSRDVLQHITDNVVLR